MNRKRLYAGLAGLFLFALVFLLTKQFFQKDPNSSHSGREIYKTLMSLKPGTSIEKVCLDLLIFICIITVHLQEGCF